MSVALLFLFFLFLLCDLYRLSIISCGCRSRAAGGSVRSRDCRRNHFVWSFPIGWRFDLICFRLLFFWSFVSFDSVETVDGNLRCFSLSLFHAALSRNSYLLKIVSDDDFGIISNDVQLPGK